MFRPNLPNYLDGTTQAKLQIDLTVLYGASPVTLQTPTSTNSDIVYTISNTNVATVIGNTLTFINPGTATLTLTQTVNGNYTFKSITSTITVQSSPIIEVLQPGLQYTVYEGYSQDNVNYFDNNTNYKISSAGWNGPYYTGSVNEISINGFTDTLFSVQWLGFFKPDVTSFLKSQWLSICVET
jgi:hypothetical protein